MLKFEFACTFFAEVTHTPMWDTKNNLQAFKKK